MLKTSDLYDLTHTKAASLLEKTTYPWEALAGIKELILALGPTLPKDEYEEISEHVWVARDAVIFPNNYLGAPCIIGHETEVRPGAFIRGSALVGDGCVVGNSTELKNVILFDSVPSLSSTTTFFSTCGYILHPSASTDRGSCVSIMMPISIMAVISPSPVRACLRKMIWPLCSPPIR